MGVFRIPVSYERGAPVHGGRVGSKVAIAGESDFPSSDFTSLQFTRKDNFLSV